MPLSAGVMYSTSGKRSVFHGVRGGGVCSGGCMSCNW